MENMNTPAPAQDSGVTQPVVESTQAQSSAPVVPEGASTYTPNFKYKIKGEEREFDEWIRPVVKDGETEKKLRRMYEQAHGLQHVEEHRNRLQREYGELNNKYSTLDSELTKLGSYVQNGDYGRFFQQMGIEGNKILQWAEQQKAEMALPPQQRAALQQQRAAQYKAEQYESEVLPDYERRLADARAKAVELELQFEIQKPHIQDFASRFDARAGEGKFYEEILTVGDLLTQQNGGVEPPVQEVFNAVMMKWKPFLAEAAPTQMTPPTQMEQAPQAQTASKKVIPNISGGGGASPIAKKPRTLADLKQLAKSLG